MNKTFQTTETVRMRDTDAAGIVYFPNFLTFSQNAFEAFISHLGFPIGKILDQQDLIFPIVHAEADFKSMLRLGEVLDIRIAVSHLGKTSFSVHNQITTGGRLAGEVKLVHVFYNKIKNMPTLIPPAFREALLPYLSS